MKSCSLCKNKILDNFTFCDDCIKPRAYNLYLRYPKFDAEDIWQMAINEIEFELLSKSIKNEINLFDRKT